MQVEAWRNAVLASPYWTIACSLGFSGVLLGAFGAHALQSRVADVKLLKTWDTAVTYQFYSTIGLLASAAVGSDRAGLLFTLGTAIFSGSLYALVLSGKRWLGAITPIGGLLLTAGWGVLLFSKASSTGVKSPTH